MMTHMDERAASFEAHRRLLFGIAYRMLGSVAEAEDAVQEGWLRFQSASLDDIESPRAWLTTVVTRLCLDQLKSARMRRESYVGPWLPEPMRTDATVDPESISLAFLVLLESLTPMERAVYLLHEVFDYSHSEIASMLGNDEAACRQLLHRAKSSVSARRPRFAPSKEAHQRLLEGFLSAVAAGDLTALQSLLAHDARLWSDGGGKATAARKPLENGEDIAKFFVGIYKKFREMPDVLEFEVADVNGWPALIIRLRGNTFQVLTIETDGEKILAVRSQLNPDKLGHV
jgi:RNA polymerase sigma-70 factor (ECF subfamily)